MPGTDISELLNAFNFYLRNGKEHAFRVFPQHKQFILDNVGKSFEDVQHALLSENTVIIPKLGRIASSIATAAVGATAGLAVAAILRKKTSEKAAKFAKKEADVKKTGKTASKAK